MTFLTIVDGIWNCVSSLMEVKMLNEKMQYETIQKYCKLIKFIALCIAIAVPSLSRSFDAELYHLVHDTTGRALIVLPNGEPEVFLPADRLTFAGYHTEISVELEEPEQRKDYFDPRFKLRGENRWVRIEVCCDDFSYVKQKNLPGWQIYYRWIYDIPDQFGDQLLHEFAGSPEASDCVPFTNMPTFIIDPQTQKPRWVKYFAVARKGWDSRHKECGRETWNINSNATVGGSPDSKSVLVSADDTGSQSRYLRVSVETGEILDPTPSGFRAIDFEDVERFKATFLRTNICPSFTPAELVREDRYLKTSAGRCMIQRRIRYEEGILRHFFGEPTPRLSF